jgi:flagellar basal body-associated protein FliL
LCEEERKMKKKVFVLLFIGMVAIAGVSMAMLRASSGREDVQVSPLYAMTLNSALGESRDQVSPAVASTEAEEEVKAEVSAEQWTVDPRRTLCP